METRPNIDSLLSFRLSEVTKDLKRVGYTLSSLESRLKVGDYAESKMIWSKGEDKVGSISYKIIKEDEGLSLELRYSYSTEGGTGNQIQTYSLVKRESNLLPGKYRYYILNPYTEEESLCTTLYLCGVDGVGFYPRSILSERGWIYRQQRESHIGRYVWSLCSQSNRNKYQHLKHRKTHYRGKPTPFWRRYTYLVEESDRRLMSYLISKGMADYKDLCSPDVPPRGESV